MVYRQPFPGPGLGVRCLGAITRDRLEAVRESDAILREEFQLAQREPEWRCLDVECEQRFLEYEHERRFSSEQQSKRNFNRRTTPGTCPHRGAEGSKPQ